METADVLDTFCLPLGTEVGPWRLEERRGCGAYGTVYRAVRVGHESQGPVALKLALYPEDPRFTREVELLSRVNHPSVPRLHDAGHWRHPSGVTFPYLAMQWVEGTALYEWAEQQALSSRQVLLLLAQLARALEATHEAGGVHRDVKGGNILVRDEDGHLFLADFGAGRHEGAATLTWEPLPPGTPAYRSPEAWRFVLRAPPRAHYVPAPADDVFALGVTAYHLVTRLYPPSTHPSDEESSLWHYPSAGPCPPRSLNPRCCAELNALILRMLDRDPEARGSARELAEAHEDAARQAGPLADRPLWQAEASAPSRPEAPPVQPVPSRERLWARSRVLVALVVAMSVMVGVSPRWFVAPSGERRSRFEVLEPVPQEDGGSAGVADAALEAPGAVLPQRASEPRIAWEMPPKPFRGQLRPDAKGRCSRPAEVIIHGACWVRIHVDDMELCKNSGYEYQGGCYWPVMATPRTPVSSPATESAQP